MILVFMILLNFLLAIIVDAFSEIKGATKERTGVFMAPVHMRTQARTPHRAWHVLSRSNAAQEENRAPAWMSLCSFFGTAGIHVELSRLLLDKWRWLAGAWSGHYVGARKLDALMRDWAGLEEEEKALASAQAGALAAADGRPAGQEDKEPRVLQVRTSRPVECRQGSCGWLCDKRMARFCAGGW